MNAPVMKSEAEIYGAVSAIYATHFAKPDEAKTVSKKFDAFVTALKQLCKEHGVTICPSEYDHLQVWDAKSDDGDLDLDRIEDRTEGSL